MKNVAMVLVAMVSLNLGLAQGTVLQGPGVITDWAIAAEAPTWQSDKDQAADDLDAKSGSWTSRLLFQVALPDVPAGETATVSSASFSVHLNYCPNWSGYTWASITLDPAGNEFTGDATWNTYDGTTAWTGGAGGGVASAGTFGSWSCSPGAAGVWYPYNGAALAGYLQDQMNAGKDAYLVMIASGSWHQSTWDMTRTSEPQANQPQLALEYTVTPEPATMSVLLLGGLFTMIRRK